MTYKTLQQKTAIINHDHQVFQVLATSRADSDATAHTEVLGKNKNELLIKAVKKNNEHLVRLLIQIGAEVNFKDHNKKTPLINAIQRGNIEIVKMLINAGANLNARDKYGDTALMKAASSKNKKLMRMLIDAGADTSIPDFFGNTIVQGVRATG